MRISSQPSEWSLWGAGKDLSRVELPEGTVVFGAEYHTDSKTWIIFTRDMVRMRDRENKLVPLIPSDVQRLVAWTRERLEKDGSSVRLDTEPGVFQDPPKDAIGYVEFDYEKWKRERGGNS